MNLALAAVDHRYRQLGRGRANVRRESLPVAAPRALSRDEQRRLLRATEPRLPQFVGIWRASVIAFLLEIMGLVVPQS